MKILYYMGFCLKIFLFICLFMLSARGLDPYAEIYRWKDTEGVIRYSNAPPDDQSSILDIIPTRQIPLVEDEDGKVYYLNVPDGEAVKDLPRQEVPGQVTLPQEVLDKLLEESKAVAAPSQASGSVDFTAMTFRLTELENTLEREITNRLEWEQKYVQSIARANEFEEQNHTLKLALRQMEAKVDKLQKAVALAEIHASAPRNSQQQLGRLEGKIGELQTYVSDVTEQIEALQAHGQWSAPEDVRMKLAALETDVKNLTDAVPLTHSVSSVVADLLESRNALQEISEKQTEQIQQQQMQIVQLQEEITSLKHTLNSPPATTSSATAQGTVSSSNGILIVERTTSHEPVFTPPPFEWNMFLLK